MSDKTQQIRERAYQIWEQQGRPEGREVDHWSEAERQLLEGLDAESANEGEGSQMGARQHSGAAMDFAQSDKAEATAQDAAGALNEGAEATELQQTEETGKRRSRGKDAITSR